MFRNADEIRKAVDEGRIVHWTNNNYIVKKDKNGEYNIVCTMNNNCIGLTWQDEKTLNGEIWDFYDEQSTPMKDRPATDKNISNRELVLLAEINFLRNKIMKMNSIPIEKTWKDTNYPHRYLEVFK